MKILSNKKYLSLLVDSKFYENRCKNITKSNNELQNINARMSQDKQALQSKVRELELLLKAANEEINIQIELKENMSICSGCGNVSIDKIEPPALSCCPDSNYVPVREYFKRVVLVHGDEVRKATIESLK